MGRLDLNVRPRAGRPADHDVREVHGQLLSGRVVLDNANFEQCSFQEAVLVYAGGPPPTIRDCSFKNITFEFEGPAGRTLALLRAMSSPASGFREVFKASFPKLFGH